MEKNKVEPSCYQFHSVRNLYKSLSETDISLEIFEYGTDAVEAKLINTHYKKQHSSLMLQFVYFNLCLIFYAVLIFLKTSIHILYTDIALVVWFAFLLWRLSDLVEYERLIFCRDFGIHLQIKKLVGKQNRFIPASKIHDIVVNEIVENVDFRYLLILRTKGTFFNKNPIICVFKAFKPTCECLSIICKHINKVLLKNEKY